MNYYIFIIGLIILILVSLYIGWKSKSKNDTNETFFLANKNLGFLSLVFTFVATQLGGGSIIGASEQALYAGPFAAIYSMGQAFGFIFLGLGLGGALRRLNVSTTAEIFERNYKSPLLRKFAAFISITSLTGILISMAVSARTFIKAIGIHNEYILIIFWSALVIYTIMGGLNAVVNTDIFQAISLLLILSFALCYTIYNNPNLISQVSSNYNWEKIYSYGRPRFIRWLLIPFLFTFIEQDLAQRCFAGRSPKIISFSAITAGIILLVSTIIPVTYGMIASTFVEPIKGSIFINSVIATTNPVISALVACAVLAAIISTSDSILVAISSNVCQDFIPNKSKNQESKFPKVITAFIGFTALFAAYYLDNIIAILIKSYELSVCCLLIPILIAAFGFDKKGNSNKAAWSAVITGFLGFVVFHFIEIGISKEIVTLILSLLSYIIVSKI